MAMLASCSLSLGAMLVSSMSREPGASISTPARSSFPRMALQTEVKPASEEAVTWLKTKGGISFLDEEIGTGERPSSESVVSLHYSVSTARTEMNLGSSRASWHSGPLAFAPGKHPVPIFAEAIEGMRVGGRRRLFVPPNKIPESQMANVPKDQSDEGLRIEIELLGTVTGPAALIPSILPPGNRRLVILRAIFFLSFLPYLLPEEIKPALWQSGDVAAIAHDRYISSYLGGATVDLDALFP